MFFGQFQMNFQAQQIASQLLLDYNGLNSDTRISIQVRFRFQVQDSQTDSKNKHLE